MKQLSSPRSTPHAQTPPASLWRKVSCGRKQCKPLFIRFFYYISYFEMRWKGIFMTHYQIYKSMTEIIMAKHSGERQTLLQKNTKRQNALVINQFSRLSYLLQLTLSSFGGQGLWSLQLLIRLVINSHFPYSRIAFKGHEPKWP